MEKVTRVLVANRPKLMREVILSVLIDLPEVQIVGEVSDENDILPQVQATLPDLLVIAIDENELRPPICDQVLREHPEVRIVALESRKNRTLYFWASLDIHCTDIETSLAGIKSVLHHPAVSGSTPL